MKNRGFSLVEILVGLVISLFLIGAMATFIGDASYNFQNHKNTVNDRGLLKRSLNLISREIMQSGVRADTKGVIEVNGEAQYFLEYAKDSDGYAILSFWQPIDDMDLLASQEPDLALSWSRVTYSVNTSRTHPTTGRPLTVLERNGVPFVIGIQNFGIQLGSDLDDDGEIIDLDGEWTAIPPDTDTDKDSWYGGLQKVKLTLSTRTDVLDGTPVINTMSQEVFLRNRGEL